ncbi:MAG: DUF1554 domain-containing protein [Myxococcota bacterium]
MRHSRLLAFSGLLLVACGGTPETHDAGNGRDAGSRADAGFDAGGGNAQVVDGGRDADAGLDAGPPRLRLFVTSFDFPGALGGLAGADAECQRFAVAANKGGTWKAFLGAGGQTALERLDDVGPWYQELADGGFRLTLNNKTNFGTTPVSPLAVDELGYESLPPPEYWTGVDADGRVDETCDGWTSFTAGGNTASDTVASTWPLGCNRGAALLCLEQSPAPAAPPLSSHRKRLFLTSTTHTGDLGGLAGADAICQRVATGGNKGGTWKAFLSDGVNTAVSRMPDDASWHQETSDGRLLLTFNNKTNVTTTPVLAPSLNEHGAEVPLGARDYWTGVRSGWRYLNGTFTLPDVPGDTCGGWTDTAGFGEGNWTFFRCTTAMRLLCFEA